MSAYNSQEFNDCWDDMPVSFQEQILQNVAQLESAALASKSMNQHQPTVPHHDTRHNKKQKHGDIDEENKSFLVYKDTTMSTTESATLPAKRKLLHDMTNQQQQQTHHSPDKNDSFEGKMPLVEHLPLIAAAPATTATNHTNNHVPINDHSTTIKGDDDDSMWLEFDDMDIPALLENMDKNGNPIKSISNNTQYTTLPHGSSMDNPIMTTLAQYDDVLQTYGGFQTAGSKKDIKPSGNSIKAAHDKALALMAEPLSSTTSMMETATQSNIPPSLDMTATPAAMPPTDTPNFNFGFSSARGTKLNEPSLQAKHEAQQLLLASPPRLSSASPSALDAPSITTSGFSTGRGTKIDDLSVDAKRKAQQLLSTPPTHRSTASLPPSTSTDSIVITNTADAQSLPEHTPQDSLDTLPAPSIYQYEDVIQQYGGFSKASGKKSDTVISEAAKQQALLLFSSDVSSTQLTQPSPHQHQPDTQSDTSRSTSHLLDLHPSSIMALVDTSSTSTVSSLLTSTTTTSFDIHHTPTSPPDQIVVSQSPASVQPTATAVTSTTAKPSVPRKKRHTGSRPRSKPFKSPAVNLDLVKAGLEKRNAMPHAKKMKGPSVFDLQTIGCRQPLSSLGAPKIYTKAALKSMNIPLEIIDMTVCKARSYVFENNWGVEEATNELMARGALSSMIPLGWVENHYGWIVFKLARHLAMFAHRYKDDVTSWWSPAHVVKQLLYRYERDINLGHRSVLKRIIEQDDVPVKQMVLMVADIVSRSESTIPIASGVIGKRDQQQHQYRLQLTDGWYQISTFVDTRMNKMIDQGRIYIGQKLIITGAQLIDDRTPKTPLEALKMANVKSDPPSSQHDSTTTSLQISSNSCLPCAWDTKLGYPRQRQRRHAIRRLDTNVYEDGGMITMMEVMVCKKYPMMYSETLANGMTVQRNSKDEEDHRRSLEIRQHARHASASRNDNGAVDTQTRRVFGYFRLRICDVNNNKVSKTNSKMVQATLMVSQATEVLHMDLLEGQCYRLFFVQPYQPKSRVLNGPYLITTRLTKWEPLSPKTIGAAASKNTPTTDTAAADLLSYPLRSISPCATIRDLTGTDVDIVVYVLHTQPQISQQSMDGRNIWYSTLLVTDSSSALCQVTYRSYYRPAQDMKGQVLGLMNVRFDTYDSRCNIIHIKTSDETEIWSKPIGTMVFMHNAMTDLKKWTESHPNDLASVQQRVKDLIQ